MTEETAAEEEEEVEENHVRVYQFLDYFNENTCLFRVTRFSRKDRARGAR